MLRGKRNFLFCFVFCFNTAFCKAQSGNDYTWYDPAKELFQTIHNRLWNGTELASVYDRLPAKAESSVNEPVWNLSKNAAGLKLVFNTDAGEISIRYVVAKKNYAMHHFSATGVTGVDLFAENKDGTWAWANGAHSFKDTITLTVNGLDLDRYDYPNGRNFHLYLPLYNTVEWLEIGVPSDYSFKFIPPSDEKPIIVYGTSIAQGACASRAGMGWTNILNRLLHTPIVNLGFSGNGRLEPELIDLIAAKDAKMFVLDCLPNLGGEAEQIYSKVVRSVRKIRSRYSDTPIILADHSGYIKDRMNSKRAKGIMVVNRECKKAYVTLKSEGVEHIYYLRHEGIGLDMNDSVDGIHPTDMGMLKYAKAYEKLIREIIN